MSDLLSLALVVGFFALAASLVRACEHLIGPAEPDAPPPTSSSPASVDAADASGIR